MNRIEQLEEELKQTQLAYQMAAQMSEFKAGFLARTAHELRSPISSLIGIHQLILSDLCESPEEQKQFIEKAYRSALKFLKLVDEIITVSKIEHGSNRLQLRPLQLKEIFAGIYQLTHLQAANRNLKLKIEEPEPNLYLLADRSRLIQSLTNLIDSGISSMKQGAIVVSAAIDNSNFLEIKIDLHCSVDLWLKSQDAIHTQENNSLDKIDTLLKEIHLSPKMKFMLSQTLLETMGGSLKLLDLSSQDPQPLTRLLVTCKRVVNPV